VKILVLNSGSSSQKSALFDLKDGETSDQKAGSPLWQAKIEWNKEGATLAVSSAHGESLTRQTKTRDRKSAVKEMLETLWDGPTKVADAKEVQVVGHRVVHGGPDLWKPTVITDSVKLAIRKVEPFAPLHNRAELEGVEIIEQLLGSVLQVAVFDTGFHRTIPLPAAVYPGPYSWYEKSIRKYGFHGINHQYCAGRVAQLLQRDLESLKLVSCHLGNGCSLAAIYGGRSVETTMGFTPLDGLMMGTRSGSVDPGILTYLLREAHTTGEKLDKTLNEGSGLLGISGVSGDMREVLAAMRDGNSRAKLAFDMYVHRLQLAIGAMAAALNGIDALVFTGGVGENSPEVRASACAKLGFIGVELDEERNRQSPADQEISLPSSRVRVLIIRAQEDWAIAQDCKQVLQHKPAN
jgi:acetate kinase